MAKEKYDAYIKAIDPKLAEQVADHNRPQADKRSRKESTSRRRFNLASLTLPKGSYDCDSCSSKSESAMQEAMASAIITTSFGRCQERRRVLHSTRSRTDADVTFAIDDVKKTIADYLASYETQRGPFRDKPSIDATKLKLIAFVQDDESESDSPSSRATAHQQVNRSDPSRDREGVIWLDPTVCVPVHASNAPSRSRLG